MYKINKSEIIAIIPARAGSKSVVDKNIKLLGGKPLLAYSVAAGVKTRHISRVIISTDSEKYAEVARQFGGEVPFKRPSEISGDKSVDYDCIKHLLDWLQNNEDSVPEFIVHLRPTTPLRLPAIIDHAVETILDCPEATALRSAHMMAETAYKALEIKDGKFKPIATDSFDMDIANRPRQSFVETYSANGYVDVLKTGFIERSGLLHGNYVLPFITPVTYEIDTAEDFELLEFKLSGNNDTVKELF